MNPIVDPRSITLPHQSHENVAAIFGKPAEAAEQVFARQRSMAQRFWEMLVGTPDNLGNVLRRLSASDKRNGLGKSIQTPDGMQVVPPIVADLMDAGYSYATADKMLSQMIKQREAYLSPKHYLPEAGKSWDEAYKGAVQTINSLSKQRKQEEAARQRGAFVGAVIGHVYGTLPPDATAEQKAEAIEKAKEQGEYELRRREYKATARKLLKDAKATPKDIPYLVNALEEILQEWQTAQSTAEVAAAEVETPEQAAGISTAGMPERQRHVA
jgi:hypothetical protein